MYTGCARTHRRGRQTSSYHWGEGEGERKHRGRGIRDSNYCLEKKLQGYIVQHGKHKPIFYNNHEWSITFKNCESLFCNLYNIAQQIYFDN